MKYPVDQIMKVKEDLAQLPKVAISDKQNVSANEAVMLMSDVLRALQEKGYTMHMMAELLNARGLGISLSTLRRYLKRTSTPDPKRMRKQKPASGRTPTAQPAAPLPVSKPATKAATKTDHPLAVAPPPSQSKGSPPQSGSKSSAFAVREDSDDI